ncbi:MAG: TetR/AcrR family transcriptional regulator [Caulobacteraceae bacterium]|nr:TetR/AcrR family transcriptional regulator [Caulobacteraceae bacterium]
MPRKRPAELASPPAEPATTAVGGSRRPRRVGRAPRLSFDQRKLSILDQAADVFAEKGFNVSTPELADHMGIAQSLIYKYYASKQVLLEAVYDHVSPKIDFYEEQKKQLQDSSLSLRTRLNRFYLAYSEVLWNSRRSKIQMWTNLLRPDWNSPYHAMIHSMIFPAILRELRIYVERDPDAPEQERETQLVRSLHGMMHHLAALRRHIHPNSVRVRQEDLAGLIDLNANLFLAGAKALYDTEIEPPEGA